MYLQNNANTGTFCYTPIYESIIRKKAINGACPSQENANPMKALLLRPKLLHVPVLCRFAKHTV